MTGTLPKLFVEGGRFITPVLCLAMTSAPAFAEEEKAGLPQFNAEWFPSQLFWLAITFTILYVFFSRTALPRIEQTLAQRQRKIQDDITNAEALSKRAQEIRESYEREMTKAREKASEALKAMDDRIKEKTNDRLYSYRTKFTAEISRAEDELNRERARLVSELNTIAAETAAHAASMILQSPADLEHAQQVVDHLRKAKAA